MRADEGHNPAAAQALFEDAMALMMAKRYREACAKFEASQRLDPGMGTQFRLAGCYENIGRIASAFRLYTEVMEAAKRERLPDRERTARQKAEALRKRLPRLKIRVAPIVASLPELKVLRDGAPVDPSTFGVSVPIDPGEHTMEATARGKTPWQEKIRAAESEALELIVPALGDEPTSGPPSSPMEAAASPPAAPSAPSEPPPPAGSLAPAPSLAPSPPGRSGGSVQRAVAIGVGLVGVSGIIAGSVLGVKARSTWGSALKQCGGDRTRCSAKGIELGESAKSSSTAATVSFAVGGVGLVAGTVLWLLSLAQAARQSPRASLSISPVVGPDGVLGVATARF